MKQKYAGFWRRFAATFIDCLVFALVPGIGSDNQTAKQTWHDKIAKTIVVRG